MSSGLGNFMVNDQSRVDELIADLDQPDKPRIRAAVDLLTPLAAESPQLRQNLERLLVGEHASQRWPIAYVLGQLPNPSGASVRTLLDGLDHREPDIRWAIALVVIRIAKDHGELIRPLIELCVTGSVNQRRMAIYCLRDLQLRDRESLQAMLQSLDDADASVRVAAVTSLKSRRDLAQEQQDKLLSVFCRDQDIKVRNAAAITLASVESPSRAAVEALTEAADSHNAQLQKAARAALKILQKNSAD